MSHAGNVKDAIDDVSPYLDMQALLWQFTSLFGFQAVQLQRNAQNV